MTFSEKLVILRKKNSLTQDEFASAVKVSRQAVYKWESGQSYPEVMKLLDIKELFNISIDDLLDDTYELPVPEKKKKKRISKSDKERIEAEILISESEENTYEVKETTETAEPEAEEVKAVEEKEEPAEEAAAKKRSFFDRLFRRK